MPASNIEHKPTEKSRAEVSALRSFGHSNEEIALYLEICDKTMVKYYKRELDTALMKANAMVANKLFKKAVEENDFGAQVFWLKTRGQWRTADKEREIKEITDSLMLELKELRQKLAQNSQGEY